MESAPITNGESSKRPRSASPVAGSPPSKKSALATDAASSEDTKPEASEASSKPPVAAQVEDEESALNVNAASAGSKWNTKVNRKNDLPKGKRGKEWKGNKDKSDRDQSWHKGADQRKPKADGETEEDGEGGKRLPKKKAAILIGYCGTGYNGMQIQNQENTKTIEGDIFAALVKAGAVSEANSEDHRKVDVQRAARTDAGVHAAGNCISMKMIVAPPLPAEHPTLASYVNSFLPEQIRMWGFVRTLKSFAARTGCDSRKYEYLLPSYCLLPPASSDYLSQALDRSSPGWRETLGPAAEFADAGVPLDAEDAAEQSENARLNPKSRGEFERRRGWRCDQQTLERFRTLVAEFKGTHNFHNYTVGKPFNDRTVRRFMMSLEVQDPVVVGEIEWISVKIHGQSFMLHQIRKMMSLAMLACRTGSPPALIKETFGPKRIHVPKAPPLGLLLEAPQFGAYNRRITEGSNGIQGGGRDLVDWDLYRKEIDEFKFKWIYDRLRQDELETNVFHKFIRQMDCTATDLLCFLNTQGIIPPEAEVSTQQPQKKKEAKEANTEGVKADSKDGEKKAALGLDSDDEEVDQEMLKRGELEG